MASWNTNCEKRADGLYVINVVWNDAKSSTVRKLNPNFPLTVHNKTLYPKVKTYLRKGARIKVIPSSLFITIKGIDKPIRLFNSTERFAKLFMTHWAGTIIGEGMSIKPNDLNEETYDEDVVAAVENAFLQSLEQTTSNNLGKNNSRKVSRLIARFETEDNTARNLKRKQNIEQKKNQSGELLKGELKQIQQEFKKQEAKTFIACSPAITESDVEPSRAELAAIVNTPPTSDTISASDLHAEAEQQRTVDEEIRKQNERIFAQYNNKFVVERIEKSKLTTTVKKVGKHFVVTSNDGGNIHKDGVIAEYPLRFKTRSGATQAQMAYEHLEKTGEANGIFCLYVAKREPDDHYNVKGTSNRQFYKLISGAEALIDAYVDDWGGTPVGYSLYKSMDQELGEFVTCDSEGEKHLEQLIESSCLFTNTLSTSSSLI